MWAALIRKETRESLGILAGAAALLFFIAAEAMQFPLMPDLVRHQVGYHLYGRKPIPFLGGSFTTMLAGVSGVLAFGLGLWQTMGESWRGTFAVLLHLPLPRPQVVGVKLATGLGLLMILAAVPIFVVAWWAASPGTHASPFEWSMTKGAWRFWLALPTVYLGAFLSGLRPARWVGTRLFPVFACGMLVALLGTDVLPFAAALAALLLVDAALVASIFYVARARDFS
jgi:hypothetical protein